MRHQIWLFLAVAACSQESPGNEVDLRPAATEIATVQCERVFECCDTEEVGRLFQAVDDVETCVPVLESYLTTFVLPTIDDALQRGAVSIDEAKKPACLSSFKATACESFVPSPNLSMFATVDCRPWIQPRLEVSGFCQEDFECISGFCARDADAVEGTCKLAPVKDEPCLVGRCSSDFYCANELCSPRLPTGDDCSKNDECESNNCVDGLNGRVCGTEPTACQG